MHVMTPRDLLRVTLGTEEVRLHARESSSIYSKKSEAEWRIRQLPASYEKWAESNAEFVRELFLFYSDEEFPELGIPHREQIAEIKPHPLLTPKVLWSMLLLMKTRTKWYEGYASYYGLGRIEGCQPGMDFKPARKFGLLAYIDLVCASEAFYGDQRLPNDMVLERAKKMAADEGASEEQIKLAGTGAIIALDGVRVVGVDAPTPRPLINVAAFFIGAALDFTYTNCGE